MAARFRIIILEGDARTYRCVFWADVPVTRQAFYSDAAKISAWKDADPTLDIPQLKSGAVTELVLPVGVPAGTTVPQAQVILQNTWQAFQDKITAENQWGRYGTTWNGTSWVANGVA